MKVEFIQGGTALRISGFTTVSAATLQENIGQCLTINPDSFYLTQNGRILHSDSIIDSDSENVPVIAMPRVLGGKGGFGSMLRAIGAQIEKTTNRDACRDLSGRRLRDINEEQRLKRWFAKQNERDEEKQELRRQKLERMRRICDGPPLPKTDDQQYNQQRADMAESVFEAVDKGFEASTSSISKPSASSASLASKPSTSTSGSESSSSSDSPNPEIDLPDTPTTAAEKDDVTKKPDKPKVVKKKDDRKIKKTMFDEDLDSDVSSSDDSEDEIPAKKTKLA